MSCSAATASAASFEDLLKELPTKAQAHKIKDPDCTARGIEILGRWLQLTDTEREQHRDRIQNMHWMPPLELAHSYIYDGVVQRSARSQGKRPRSSGEQGAESTGRKAKEAHPDSRVLLTMQGGPAVYRSALVDGKAVSVCNIGLKVRARNRAAPCTRKPVV